MQKIIFEDNVVINSIYLIKSIKTIYVKILENITKTRYIFLLS